MQQTSAMICFNTMVRKEVRRFMSMWIQTVLPPAVTTTLYFIIFGHLIGERIGSLDGTSYIDYIAPGLIMMTVITNAYANVVASFFTSKFFRNIEELLIAPISNTVILAGYVTGGVIRGVVVAIVVALIAFIFTGLHVQHFFFMLAGVLLSSIVFSLAGLINGVYAKKFDDISVIPTFVLTPLIYLGGVFYSIHLLPEFWQKFTLLNPIFYFINLFRYAMIGISDVNIWSALLMLIFLTVALYLYALFLLNKGIGIKS